MAFEILDNNTFFKYAVKPDTVIIDLRAYDEYREWHYDGAIRMDMDNYYNEIQNFDKDTKLIFYCDRGANSMLAARNADNLGFDAKSVVGGYKTIMRMI